MLTTSFRLLHKAGACAPRYKYLAKALGGIKSYGKDTPIPLTQILEINGWRDAEWCLGFAPTRGQFRKQKRVLELFLQWRYVYLDLLCGDAYEAACAQQLKELLNESR